MNIQIANNKPNKKVFEYFNKHSSYEQRSLFIKKRKGTYLEKCNYINQIFENTSAGLKHFRE